MTAGENFTLWPFQVNRPAKKSDHTRKRSLKLEQLEERQMLAVTPWEYASHMQDAYEYEDVSSYDPLDDMEDHWTEEDEAAAEAERLQLTAAALREKLRGYGVSSMVSKQVYGPETLEQYRAVTFGLGVRNAGLDNPSLLNNGEFDNAYEVDTLWDVIDPTDGVTSLREAIISANTFAGYDLITFASGLSGTIYLSGTALPTITEGLNIQGPGDDVLTIDAGDLSRIFVIVGTDPNDPTPDVPTGLSGASSATGDSVALSWTASADANMYAVYRRVFGVQGDSWGQWSYLDETTETIYTDNTVNPETTYQYYLIAANDTTGKMSSPSTTVTVTTNPNIWIDLDIDSLNTSRFATPSRTQAEEDIEDDPSHFGKIIQPNYGDRDGDGVLDCWDGYSGSGQTQSAANASERFVPIVISIPDNIDLDNASFQIDHWSGSVTVTPGSAGRPPQFGDGNIRIWNKDGDEARSANSLHLGGNLVMDSMSYTATQLGFTEEIRTITLYVEGYRVSSSLGNREIIVRMEYDHNNETFTVEDRVKYTVAENLLRGKITYGAEIDTFGVVTQTYDDPVRYATMIITDVWGIFEEQLAKFYTDENGEYCFPLTNDIRERMDYIKVLAYSDKLEQDRTVSVGNIVLAVNTDTYSVIVFDAINRMIDTELRDSDILDMVIDCHIDTSSPIYGNTQTQKEAFYVYDAMVTGAQIHATLPDVDEGHVTAVYPWTLSDANAGILAHTFIVESCYNDWDIILHEYGHVVAQQAETTFSSFWGFFDLDLDVTAKHNAHASHSDYLNMRDYYDHSCAICPDLAFSEGWANFYGAYSKRNGYTPSYITAQDKLLFSNRNPELHDSNTDKGEDHEYAVMQLFWDLYDGRNEPFDDVEFGFAGVYNILRIGTPKYNVDALWDYLVGTIPSGPDYLENMTRYGKLFASHGIGVPDLSASAHTWQQGMDIPTFYWDNIKTSDGYNNLFDRYTVEFYGSSGNLLYKSVTIFHVSTATNTVTWTPTTIQWGRIIENIGGENMVYGVVRAGNQFNQTFTHNTLITGEYWNLNYTTLYFS